MPKHVLFVCKSCNSSSTREENQDQPDGSQLLNQLLALRQDCSRQDELQIQGVDCLWACSHPCVVALAGTDKLTYLFVELTPQESDAALMDLAKLYLDSNNGSIPWSKFPETLKSVAIAKIPPVVQD